MTSKKQYVTQLKWIQLVIKSADSPEIISSPVMKKNIIIIIIIIIGVFVCFIITVFLQKCYSALDNLTYHA